MIWIERATAADLQSILAIVRAAYAPYVARIGREPAPMGANYAEIIAQERAYLAREADSILGLVVVEMYARYLLVENVAVDPAVHGHGIVSALLSHADTLAREAGLTEVRLYTNARMTENLLYYPKRGYRTAGRATENGFERVYFVKSLLSES